MERVKRENAATALPEYAALLPPESNKLGLQARNAVQAGQITSANLRSLEEWTAATASASAASAAVAGGGRRSSSPGHGAVMHTSNYSGSPNHNNNNNATMAHHMRNTSGAASNSSGAKNIPSWLTQARTAQQLSRAHAGSLPGGNTLTAATTSERLNSTTTNNNSSSTNPNNNNTNNINTAGGNVNAVSASTVPNSSSHAFASSTHTVFSQNAASSVTNSTQPLQRRRHIRANRPVHTTTLHACGGNIPHGVLTDSAASVAGCYTASGNISPNNNAAGLPRGVLIAAETVHEEPPTVVGAATGRGTAAVHTSHTSSHHHPIMTAAWSQPVPRSPLYAPPAVSVGGGTQR